MARQPTDEEPAVASDASEEQGTTELVSEQTPAPAGEVVPGTPRAARARERRGVVVSNAMDKTIVVRVEKVAPHRRYQKVVRRSKKLHAHDEGNVAKVGDIVRIVESRPFSRTKSWRLAEVVEEAR